jgi:hypothetical protein
MEILSSPLLLLLLLRYDDNQERENEKEKKVQWKRSLRDLSIHTRSFSAVDSSSSSKEVSLFSSSSVILILIQHHHYLVHLRRRNRELRNLNQILIHPLRLFLKSDFYFL